MKQEAHGETIQEALRQDVPAHEVSVVDLLATLVRRRRFILWCTVGATVLTAVIVFLIPSRYTATTVVLPPSQNSSMSSALMGQLGGSGALASMAGESLGIKNPGDMYVSLFRSQTVENALIERFGLMSRYHKTKISDGRRAFEDRSTVLLGAKDGLIRISVTDRDPRLAAEIANAYVDEFRKLTANLAITEASQRRAFFQQQLLEADQNLTAAEEAMKHTQQSTGILQLDSQAKSLIESAALMRGQIAAKEVQLQAMRSYATDDNPQMVVAGQQLAGLKTQLAKLTGSVGNSDSDIIVPKGNMPQAGMEYLNKLRDVRYYETITELIAKQFEMAKLDEARQGAIIQVADPALVPDARSFPKRMLTILLALFGSFILACIGSFVMEGFQKLKPKLREIVQS
jgi:uncharacterized protein involved in exopolysaccharide biosynthesis